MYLQTRKEDLDVFLARIEPEQGLEVVVHWVGNFPNVAGAQLRMSLREAEEFTKRLETVTRRARTNWEQYQDHKEKT